MSIKVEIVSHWDYKEAVKKINELLDKEIDLKNVSGKEIVDLVILR